MKALFTSLYTITLALWTGGMTIFTLVVTPAIFRSYSRDVAGEIVGRLFPGYFLYTLALSALALLLFLLLGGNPAAKAYRFSLFLLTAALLVNAYITFKLHPDAVQIKRQVTSFEQESSDSPARREFRRLHGISAVLNLCVLADGITLLVLSPFLKK
jgi:hypothetical protein